MGIRIGEQYVYSLRDGRRLYIDGKVVSEPGIDADRRPAPMKMVRDMTGTPFGARAGLYERLYSGDPEINGQRWFGSGITRDCEALVQELLGP